MQLWLSSALTLLITCLGVYTFTYGFFFVRYELSDTAVCSTPAGQSCWNKGQASLQVTTLVFVIIDALRFDYLYYNTSLSDAAAESSYYLNKLPVIHRLSGDHGRVYRTIVDAPTVTMQRLKGMTTGNLPTFIDMKNNFDSSDQTAHTYITEDSWLRQARLRHDAHIVHMGDDTWATLYGKDVINVSYPYPSFNVKDLHTVDNGVLSHIYDELNSLHNKHLTDGDKQQLNIVVAHFLGVDHVGHRYGPNHAEMTSKLTQMDDVIEKVSQYIDKIDQSMLIVMGDHGMTEDGNHGGATYDEINAGLFVYSNDKLPAAAMSDGEVESINQIDLVATIAYWLDTAIPFNNVGVIVQSLVPSADRVNALRINAQQVLQYLTSYNGVASIFSTVAIDQLVTDLGQITNAAPAERAQLYSNWLHHVTNIFRHKFTVFNMTAMLVGITLMFGSGVFVGLNLVRTFNHQLNFIEHSSSTSQSARMIRTLSHTAIVLSLVAYYQGLFTNSFTLVDAYVQRTIAVTVMLLSAGSVSRKDVTIQYAAALLLATVCVRLMSYGTNVSSDVTYSSEVFELPTATYSAVQLLFVTDVAILMTAPTNMLFKLVSVFMAALLLMFWSLPHEGQMIRLHVPRLVYSTFPASMLHTVTCRPAKRTNSNADDNRITQVASSSNSIQPVYWSLLACYVLLHGPLLTQNILLFVVVTTLITTQLSTATDPVTLSIQTILYWLLGNTLFYASNHRADFNALHVSCAFVGFDTFNYFIAGTLLMINTFGHTMLTCIAGCATSVQHRTQLPVHVLSLLYLLRAVCSMINVTIQRRHLMVWAIFAPKFMFDNIDTIIALLNLTCVSILLHINTTMYHTKRMSDNRSIHTD